METIWHFAWNFKHVEENDGIILTVDLISNEAIKTSVIEGEILNRYSVQSSIRRNFGLDTDNRKVSPAEQGIAEMMVDLIEITINLFLMNNSMTWHSMLTLGRRDLRDIGSYRTYEEPMQIISGLVISSASMLLRMVMAE